MKIFFYKIVIFFIPIAIIFSIIEYKLRIIPNNYSYKSSYLDRNAEKIEVLILGNSHSFYGLNPSYIEYSCFNAANVSQTINIDYFILKKYLTKFKSLKLVIIPISYSSLFSFIEEGKGQWRIKNYCIYYNYPSYDVKNHFEILNGKMNYHINRITNYHFQNKGDINCSKLGFGLDYKFKHKLNFEVTGKEAAIRHTKENINNTLIRSKQLLRRIFDDCSLRGIKVVLFTPPAHRDYRKWIDEEQFKLMDYECKSLVKESSNVYYYSYFESDKFEDIDFFDADHLNHRGARKLSVILNKLVIKKINNE